MRQNYFTTVQAKEIIELLEQKSKTNDKKKLKSIYAKLRYNGFYISDYNNEFTSKDFLNEIENGNIIIYDSPNQEYNTVKQTENTYNTIQESDNKNLKIIAIIVFIALLFIVGILSNKETTPKVIKGKSYNPSYDNQIKDLQRDIKKCDEWVEGIVIYDENCDTVATINR